MITRLNRPSGSSALVVLAAALACGTGGEDRSERDPSALLGQEAGSAVPCAVPLAWRVGRVDDGFGLSRAEVEDAVRTAVGRWERAAERDLFVHDSDAGMPVHLVYGDRQAALDRWLRTRRALRDQASGLEALGEELARDQRELTEAWSEFERRWNALNRRVARHNERARALQERGDVTEEEVERLRREREEIESERRRLERRRDELRERERRLNDAIARLNRQVDGFNQSSEATAEVWSQQIMDAGQYSENVRFRGDRIESVTDRKVEVYQFSDSEVLARVVAHELGHALGLGHARDTAAVMAGTNTITGAAGDPWSIRPADVAMLREVCARARP